MVSGGYLRAISLERDADTGQRGRVSVVEIPEHPERQENGEQRVRRAVGVTHAAVLFYVIIKKLIIIIILPVTGDRYVLCTGEG